MAVYSPQCRVAYNTYYLAALLLLLSPTIPARDFKFDCCNLLYYGKYYLTCIICTRTRTRMFSIYKIAFEKEAPERMIQFLGETS